MSNILGIERIVQDWGETFSNVMSSLQRIEQATPEITML